MKDSRISSAREKFAKQIRTLDNLQLSDGIAAGTKKWEDFKWVLADSQFVTKTRDKSDEYMAQIADKRHCPPEIKDEHRLLIKSFMNYDHGDVEPKRLLDKIALYGSVSDCEAVNIKRGTLLQDAPSQEGNPVLAKMLKPLVSLRKNGIGEQLLTVVNSTAPNSRALPDGVRCARVFRYIGTSAPASFEQYTSVGNAKRGLFLSKFTEALPPDKVCYAWYIAVYENTKGDLLDLSESLRVEIFMSKG
jgi:hypothetical protein